MELVTVYDWDDEWYVLAHQDAESGVVAVQFFNSKGGPGALAAPEIDEDQYLRHRVLELA